MVDEINGCLNNSLVDLGSIWGAPEKTIPSHVRYHKKHDFSLYKKIETPP